MKFASIVVLSILHFGSHFLVAQCDIIWDDPSPLCGDATVIDFHSRCFMTNSESSETHEGFCGGGTILNNPQYFSFIATDTIVIVCLARGDCDIGVGLQSAIIDISDLNNCRNWMNGDVIACDPNFHTTTQMIAWPMTVGDMYIVVVDGTNGARCEYQLIPKGYWPRHGDSRR